MRTRHMWLLGKCQNLLVENHSYCAQVLVVSTHHRHVHTALAQTAADLCETPPALELPPTFRRYQSVSVRFGDLRGVGWGCDEEHRPSRSRVYERREVS